MLQQTARITNVAQAYEVIKEMNPLAHEFTLLSLIPGLWLALRFEI